MYKFSAPMPYSIEDIDKILSINNQVEKSKITSLYASLPGSCNMFTGFEQMRNTEYDKTDFDYWKNLFCHSLEKGVDFIYLLNSPLPFDLKNNLFEKQLEKLDSLLNELQKIGITKLRVTNPQLMTYLHKHYKNFDIYASTSLDYKTMSEYHNFLLMHPEVKQIVPSHDTNKNFKFLKNLKLNYPKLDIEIMVNEGCMKGCPHRNLHENLNYDNTVKNNNDLCYSPKYCITFCSDIGEKYPFISLTLNNNIFPWEINEYSKIGINKFKLVGRDAYSFGIENYLKKFLLYFKGIDNIKNIENVPINTFIHHLLKNPILSQLTVKGIKHLLPNINHFVKKGQRCASICGAECNYCYKCANKIQKIFQKQEKQAKKYKMPMCIINKELAGVR